MSEISSSIMSAVKGATKEWKAAKRKADKEDRVSERQLRNIGIRYKNISIREAAFHVMEGAYNKVSSNGKYYANARQIMYAARPEILRMTGKQEFDDVYFTQTLLKDYIEIWRKENKWKVVWDARGHLIEPYMGTKIGLGGIDVNRYINSWHKMIHNDPPQIPVLIDSSGPELRFRNVLFIEKEGFTEVLSNAGIQERFDIGLMSAKGIPNKASCDIISQLTSKGVRVFVLRDFDLEGFKIVRTLRNGTRLAHGSDVIDLGLRFEDIEGLQSEPVIYRQEKNPKRYLMQDCDATAEEAHFLVSNQQYRRLYEGQRVEINAMTSEQLITWLERKFKEHGVKKFIPDDELLIKGYKRALHLHRLRKLINDIEMKEDDTDIPDNISEIVNDVLLESPELSWDTALWNIANKHSSSA